MSIKHPLTAIISLTLLFTMACSDKQEEESEPRVFTVNTFQEERHAFGEGHSQTIEGVFDFPADPTNVERIRMYVRLLCPDEGCNAWDMFANIRVRHPETNDWLEIGRYITPYGVDNSQAGRGFMIDVTDFKSLLTGEVHLRSFVEVWGSDGWLVSVDFEIIEGTPDYPYYAVIPLLDYASWSLGGVPYGESHDFELGRMVSIPENIGETRIRTIITGWGHATPADPDGRPCAEWCFRTHEVLINNEPVFLHVMDGMGCDKNPVQPQNGNWAPDRAGWCPGMAVPVRTDIFATSMQGTDFSYEYRFEQWINNFNTTADNPHAYYAISSFVIVKSNNPITF